MDRISLSFGLAVGFEFLRTCSSFPVNNYRDAFTDSSTWIGVSVVVSLAFVVVGILFLAGCLCCRRETDGFKPNEQNVDEKNKEEFHNSVTNLSQAGLGFTNPSLNQQPHRGANELSIFPPAGAATSATCAAAVTFEPLPAHIQPPPAAAYSKPPAFAAGQSTNHELDIGDWFAVGKNSNFPREQLHYLREYGRGWFGRVVEGEARGVGENGRNCKVVVRILREDATASEQKFFLNEVKTFRDLSHPNVLRLVARCLETDPYLILLESCSSGDLKSFLCGNVASRTALCEQGICLRMMCDVANGLQHILQHGFVHTDLAARNCLVTSDLTVKVGDYGTSIEMYKDDYYIAGDVALPIRWCAPESLHCTDTTIETKQVTSCANVWSFGVVLWEVCEFGALPYTSLSDDQVIVRVLGKERLKLAPPTHPSLHTAHLYSLMQMCWNEEATRPSLDHVIAMLKHLQMSRTSDSDDNFERRWETLKPNTIPVTDNQSLTIRSDFDSGVDLDLKTNSDHDLKSSALDLKSSDFDLKSSVTSSSHFDDVNSASHFDDVNSSSHFVLDASNSDIRTSSDFDSKLKLNSSATGSPQLSVASSLGGEYFASTTQLARQLSPSLTNLRGSFEDVAASDDVVAIGPSHLLPQQQQKPSSFDFITSTVSTNNNNIQSDTTDQFDSWLQGVDTTDEEEVKFVKNISEAIRDLDNRLAMEKTSSSSEASSRHESPVKEASVPQQNPVLDFRLGPITCLDSRQPLLSELDSLQEDSLCVVRRDSSSDTEEETWRGRIERGEFTEKVKEKSKSVADLMILTHIENSSDESDSLPSLTRQFSIEKNRRFVTTGKNLAVPMMTSIGFGSEGNIRGAVLGEEFQESLKLLQTAWKVREAESRQASLTVDQVQNEPCEAVVTSPSTNLNDGSNFLGDTASEKNLVCVSGENKKVSSQVVEEKMKDGGDESEVRKNEEVSLSTGVENVLKTVEYCGESDVNIEKKAETVRKNEVVLLSSGVVNVVETVKNCAESVVNIEKKAEFVEEMCIVDENLKQKSEGVEGGETQVSQITSTVQENGEILVKSEIIIEKQVDKTTQDLVIVLKKSEEIDTQAMKPASNIQDNVLILKKTEKDIDEENFQRINYTSNFLENEKLSYVSENVVAEDTRVIQSTSEIQENQKSSNLTSAVNKIEFNSSKSDDNQSKIENIVGENIKTSSRIAIDNDSTVTNLSCNQVESDLTTKENADTLVEASSHQPSGFRELDNFSESQIEENVENCETFSRVKRRAPQFDENFLTEKEVDKFIASNQTKENGNFDEFFSKIESELNGNTMVKDDESSEKSPIEEFLSRERDVLAHNNKREKEKVEVAHLSSPQDLNVVEVNSTTINQSQQSTPVENMQKVEENSLDNNMENKIVFEETVRNDFEIMDSLPESDRIYENELSDSTNKESPDDVTSDITSFVQSPLDSSTGLLQDNLDSKETSLSELESSSQSSEQTMTVVENDPLRNEEVIPDLNNSSSEVTAVVNGGGKLPEIVVTEAVDVENLQIINQDTDCVSAKYEFKPRRQIRILIANDSSDDTDSENDGDVFDDSKFPIVVSALNCSSSSSSPPPSQPTTKQLNENDDKVVDEVESKKLNSSSTSSETTTKNQKENVDEIEIEKFNSSPSQQTTKHLDEVIDEVGIEKLNSSSSQPSTKQQKEDLDEFVDKVGIEKLTSPCQPTKQNDDKAVDDVKIEKFDQENSFKVDDTEEKIEKLDQENSFKVDDNEVKIKNLDQENSLKDDDNEVKIKKLDQENSLKDDDNEIKISKLDEETSFKVDDNEVKISKLDLEKSFNTSDAINIFSLDEEVGTIDKLKAINVDLQVANVEDTKQTASNSNINESYSVILGSCEDYTLDYFKGLKTTSGKPATFDSDYSTNEISKSDSEIEDTDVSSTDNINNWDTFLTNSLKDNIIEKEENFNVQFNNNVQQLDSVGSSDVNSEDTVVDDDDDDENEEEESERLNKKNLDFSRDNNNFINEKNLNSRLLPRDFENRNSRIIQDRIIPFDNGGGVFQVKEDQDRQMHEIKSRLEDVAKLSEGFQLKKEAEEEEDEGKLLTPDDERSSDSGFRDKGSLSESVEDACDEKYNLEDIEAELEEAYTKTNTESKYFSLHDENSSSSGEFSALASFPTPCSSKVDFEDKVKEEGEEVECLRVKESNKGWFLHPHRGATAPEEDEDSMSGWYPSPVTPELVKGDESPRSFRLDEELDAIRNELQEKLPCAQQIPHDADEDNSPEQERTDMVIEYGSYPVPLSPILEERESVSSNQSSIILDLHSSNVSSGKSSPVMMMLDRNDSFDDDDDEVGKKFEEDIRTALDLYSSDSVESDEVVDIIVEDLDDKEGGIKVRGETKEDEEEDLLIVNTETNEAQLLESPRPKSHLAFVKKSKIDNKNISPMNGNTYTPDSISPISTGSSRTGVALSFSSPDTGGNLSSFLSPSNSENVDSEYSVNNSLDLDVAAKDLKSVPNFFDHKEMFDKLKELEEESSDSSEMSSERTISVPGRSVQELMNEGKEEEEELGLKENKVERDEFDVNLENVQETFNTSATSHEEAVSNKSIIEEKLLNDEIFDKKEAINDRSELNHEEIYSTKNFEKVDLINDRNIEEKDLTNDEIETNNVKTSPTKNVDDEKDLIKDKNVEDKEKVCDKREANNVKTSPTKNLDKENLTNDENIEEKELINNKSGTNHVKPSPTKNFDKEDLINDGKFGEEEPVSNKNETNNVKTSPTKNVNKEELIDDRNFDKQELTDINKELLMNDKITDKKELLLNDAPKNDKNAELETVSTDLVLEKLLETKATSRTDEQLIPHPQATTEESKDWLKSVLLPLTTKPAEKVQSVTTSNTVLPKSSWPSSHELIPEKLINEVGDCDKKKVELNSTLALLSPNLSVGTDSSMVSSFSSTPTFDTTKSINEMSLSISSTDGEDSQRVLVPSLRALASEVLRLHKKVLKPISDEVSLSKKNLTLALDSSIVSKVPMPSPEDADKGTWKPAVNSQLMDLTTQSEHDLESDDLMTTSFIDGDGDQYNPDWESDTSEGDSEDHSSSSGEFIWKSQDDIADQQQHGMARIDEEDEEEEEAADDDDDSSCGSTTEFVPSIWDKAATPTKSALRLADKTKDSLKRVCFKEQEYHCVYEYPGEPSDSDDDDDDDAMDSRKRNWETPSCVDYSCFADWELAEGESATDRDITDRSAEDYAQKSSSKKHKKNDFDFYQLGAIDYDFTQMTTDDGEFFISSSARPFQGFSDASCSEFFPGGRLSFDLDDEAINQSSDIKANITTDKLSKEFINNEKGVTNNSSANVGIPCEQVGVGGLRHTREWLKLDLPATFTAKSSDRPASFSSHSSAVHEAKLSKSQSSDFPTTSKSSDQPTKSSDFPTNLSDPPTNLSDLPTNLSDFPTNFDLKLSDLLTNSSDQPTILISKSSDLPTQSSAVNESKVSEIQETELPKVESALKATATVNEGSEIDVA